MEFLPSKYGLIRDDEATAILMATAAYPVFAAAAPRVMDRQPREVFFGSFLDAACKEHYGNDWRFRSQYQKRGTCGGQGSKLIGDFALSVRRFLYGERFPGRTAVAPNYGGSRQEVGGGRIRGDGTAAPWVAKWLTQWGMVTLAELGLPENYHSPRTMDADEALAIEWGSAREGVPTHVEQLARERPFKAFSLIRSIDELLAAQSNYNVCWFAADLIPTGNRNRLGLSSLEREGGHFVACCGQKKLPNGEWMFGYHNSWSDQWASGYWPLPKHPEYAGSVVWLSERNTRRILEQSQSYAMIHPEGLEPVDEIRPK